MKLQSINLYPEHLRPKPVILSLNQGILATLIFTLLLLGKLLTLSLEKVDLIVKVGEMTNDLNLIELETNVFDESNPKKTVSVSLKEKQALYQSKLDQRVKLLSRLESSTFGYTQGFSKYLDAATNQLYNTFQSSEAISLTYLYVKEDAKETILKGTVLRSEAVPTYIKNLQQEKVFEDVAFTGLTLLPIYQPGERFEFELSRLQTSEEAIEDTVQRQKHNAAMQNIRKKIAWSK